MNSYLLCSPPQLPFSQTIQGGVEVKELLIAAEAIEIGSPCDHFAPLRIGVITAA
jgi:hypothetical protein